MTESDLGLVRFSGPDAASFLQGQVTNDVSLLADARTMLAACNTPQGRVVAVLRLRQAADAIYAVVAADVVPALLDHLRRFVLRAKVRVELDGRSLRPVGDARAREASQGAGALRFDWLPGRALIAV